MNFRLYLFLLVEPHCSLYLNNLEILRWSNVCQVCITSSLPSHSRHLSSCPPPSPKSSAAVQFPIWRHSASSWSQPRPDHCGNDLEWPPGGAGGAVTRRGRRGASASRRGCRGGQAWRRSGPSGRQRCLLAGLINIQSLLPKIASLQHEHLNRLHYDICVITETWLRSATASRLITFTGYTLHRADRPGDVGHGGVGILLRDCYRASVIS